MWLTDRACFQVVGECENVFRVDSQANDVTRARLKQTCESQSANRYNDCEFYFSGDFTRSKRMPMHEMAHLVRLLSPVSQSANRYNDRAVASVNRPTHPDATVQSFNHARRRVWPAMVHLASNGTVGQQWYSWPAMVQLVHVEHTG